MQTSVDEWVEANLLAWPKDGSRVQLSVQHWMMAARDALSAAGCRDPGTDNTRKILVEIIDDHIDQQHFANIYVQ